MFDLIFNKIDMNMREIGYGDTVINKNMKFLVKSFYNILLNFKNFNKDRSNASKIFFYKYLKSNKVIKNTSNYPIIQYFDKYQAFCFDLSLDSVLKGVLNFKYK